ncbi:hypothetical protein SF123566_5397 [Shigella flexneri 1235-66]|nr:hypothetical protein SF123566_5397 [Shigella flexneri 1235-66]
MKEFSSKKYMITSIQSLKIMKISKKMLIWSSPKLIILWI